MLCHWVECYALREHLASGKGSCRQKQPPNGKCLRFRSVADPVEHVYIGALRKMTYFFQPMELLAYLLKRTLQGKRNIYF